MSIVDKRRYTAAAFIVLLTLSVYWPSPVVSVNRLAGILALVIIQTGEFTIRDFVTPWQQLLRLRWSIPRSRVVIFLIVTAALVTFAWFVLDAPVTAWAEAVQSDGLETVIRLLNRLGGGMNPVLLIAFFLLAGVAYKHEPWIRYGVAMVVAGISAGLLVQIVKLLVGRSRPELWLGPFHHARMSASSFPSGHTVGAFALAGVLVLGSPNRLLRAVAFLIAAAIGFSRVLAFRHWTSDVVASAALGLFSAWIAWSIVTAVTRTEVIHS
jgi:membrane-associated phospholipid phosphatase